MNYHFDQVVDRRGSNSIKYDFTRELGKPQDVLPMWVADMDFPSPPEVREALHKACDYGVFGYTQPKELYMEAVSNWFLKHHAFCPKAEWLIFSPGVVFGLSASVRAFTEPGDSVLIQQPVYYPFEKVVVNNGRKLVINELCLHNGHYEIDFKDFEEKIVKNNVKLFLLCSPHNPVGRVWKREELMRIGQICLAHQVLVVSDEIHCDFTYPGFSHMMFPSLSETFAQNCILCTAPSKTFNLAGLQVSNLFVPNESLRKKLDEEIKKTGYVGPNQLGTIACEAAYRYGDLWLKELSFYLKENLDFVRKYLAEKLPQIHLIEPEGTYLLWLDFRALEFSPSELDDFITKKARLWLDDGPIFGQGGEGFQRMNIACPRSVLEIAMDRLKWAIDGLN